MNRLLFSVALVLSVARPNENWQLFRTGEFQPPKDTQDLVTGEIRNIRPGLRPAPIPKTGK